MKRGKRAVINGAARNIMMNRVGGSSNSDAFNYRVSLPSGMVEELGVTKEDKAVFLEWDAEKKAIIIRKKEIND